MVSAVQGIQGALPSNSDFSWPAPGHYLSQQQAFNLWKPHIEAMSQITGIPANILAGMMYAESSGNPMTSTVNPGDGKQDVGLMQISQERWAGEVLPWAQANLSEQQKDALCRAFGISSLDEISLDPATLQQNPGLSLVAGALEAMMKLEQVGGNINSMLGFYNTGDRNAQPQQYLDNVFKAASAYASSN